VALSADTEVMRYLDHGRPIPAARVLDQEMPRLMAHDHRVDRLGSWAARDRRTGNFLGWFMIAPVDQPLRTVELAYRLRRKAWGRGYEIEGLLHMIDIARAARYRP
jgi:RimJ/RimL family protein N-acetyltransferase